MKKKILIGYIVVLGTYLFVVIKGIIGYDSYLAQTINTFILWFNVMALFTMWYLNKKKKKEREKENK